MKKILVLIAALALVLTALVGGGAALAYQRSVNSTPTTLYTCIVTETNAIDEGITPNAVEANVTCPAGDTAIAIDGQGIQGPKGNQGNQGDPGPQGSTGATGPAGPAGAQGPSGVPFTHAACTESYTNGAEQQENLLFCLSGVAPDGGNVYTAAVTLAKNYHLIIGTPISSAQAVDWNGLTITYVEFTSGFHAEYHADNVVRIYNDVDHQVF